MSVVKSAGSSVTGSAPCGRLDLPSLGPLVVVLVLVVVLDCSLSSDPHALTNNMHVKAIIEIHFITPNLSPCS